MSETFRLTKRRIDLGILSPQLEEYYNRLTRAAKIVQSIKAKNPDKYVNVVKDMVDQVNAEQPTKPARDKRSTENHMTT